jgi:hypothetical protein
MVPKLDVESVRASHLEGQRAHLFGNLKVSKCTKSCYISRHIAVNFSVRDKTQIKLLTNRMLRRT